VKGKYHLTLHKFANKRARVHFCSSGKTIRHRVSDLKSIEKLSSSSNLITAHLLVESETARLVDEGSLNARKGVGSAVHQLGVNELWGTPKNQPFQNTATHEKELDSHPTPIHTFETSVMEV
jgi:hypothetical protein